MAHIIYFSVTGLIGRKEPYTCHLDRHINIYFGLNGSGKTSLLRILNSAMGNDGSLLANVPFETAEVVLYSAYLAKEYTFTIENRSAANSDSTQGYLFNDETIDRHEREIRYLDYLKKNEMHWTVSPAFPEGHPGRLRHTFLSTTRLFSRARSTAQRVKTDEFFDLHFEETFQRHWLNFFGDIQARVRASQEEGLAAILNEVIKTRENSAKDCDLDWKKAFEQTLSFLRRQNPNNDLPNKAQFQKHFATSATLRNVVQHIDRVEQEIVRAMATTTQFEALISRLFTKNKTLKFGPTSVDILADEKSIGLRSLSSGEKQILKILFEVINIDRSTLMIDEPEISMHIDWQRELVEDMRSLNPNAQLILATHSPEIMADVDDSHIFRI